MNFFNIDPIEKHTNRVIYRGSIVVNLRIVIFNTFMKDTRN